MIRVAVLIALCALGACGADGEPLTPQADRSQPMVIGTDGRMVSAQG